MIKKVIIGLSILLIFLVVGFILFFNSLRQKNVETSQTFNEKQLEKKTLNTGQQNLLKKLTSSGYETNNFRVTCLPSLGKCTIEKKSPQADTEIQNWARDNGISVLIYDPDYFLLKENGQLTTYLPGTGPLVHNSAISSLTPLQQSNLESVKRTLPYNSPDITVVYSSEVDSFIVQKKTGRADAALQTWADENGVGPITDDSNIFVKTTQTPEAIIPTLQITPTPNPTGTSDLEKSYSLLKTLTDIADQSITRTQPTPIYPQPPSNQPTNVPRETTPINQPPDPNTNIVVQIVHSIQQNCHGYIDKNTYPCLQRVTLLTDPAYKLLKQSAIDWSKGNLKLSLVGLQCVGFVRAMAKQTTGNNVLEGGDARSQLRPQNGYRVVYNTAQNRPKIKPGDIPVWSTNHIAYVVEVQHNNNGVVIVVAEANIPPAQVELRPVSLSNPAIAGWLTPQ